jgi:hypothetical protein
MKRTSTALSLAVFLLSLTPAAWGQYTVWHSPLTFTSDNTNLSIRPSNNPPTALLVSTATIGGNQWIYLGLIVPSNVRIDSAIVYYQLINSASFISQTRLMRMNAPDAAFIQLDDPTDLTSTSPSRYATSAAGLVASGTITLGLLLNLTNTGHSIEIGAIGLVVRPLTTAIEEKPRTEIPEIFKLDQNYPNPFNPQTIIEYEMAVAGKAEVRIYNNLGQAVRALVDEEKSPGLYRVVWDGKDDLGRRLASGVYFYQLKVNDFASAKRMILAK